MALIESLRLNKGEQQDAAEFSKLFLDMIASELSKQKDESIRDLTRNMVSLPPSLSVKAPGLSLGEVLTRQVPGHDPVHHHLRLRTR